MVAYTVLLHAHVLHMV